MSAADQEQQTVYKPRQSRYIRISPNAVLTMILYLDERHTFWMNNLILERVLLALKDRIGPKLRAESNTTGSTNAKAKVDVYRGAGWQCAYFFRKTAQKHSVLLKHRSIVNEPVLPKKEDDPESSTTNKRKRTDTSTVRRKSARKKDDSMITQVDSGDEAEDDELPPPLPEVKDEIVDVDPAQAIAASAPTLVDDDDEKPDLKPRLKVSYSGFSIFGRTLVVIVEPYPPLTAAAIRSATPAAREPTRQLSATPLAHSRERSASAMLPPPLPQQPLFRAETPASESEEEDLSQFRFRSQSLAMSDADHLAMRERELSPEEEVGQEDPFDLDIPQERESLMSQIGNSRDVQGARKDLDLKQFY